MTASASHRGWQILARLVLERAGATGPDRDLTEDEKAEALEQAAEDARVLLKDKRFQALRLQGLEAVVADFAEWLDLDPTTPNYERELAGIHRRASSRYWELFRPEMIIKEAKDQAKKRERGGER